MKRPSDPRKTRPTSGAGGSGPKTRRSQASTTSKRGPARGESAEPGADGPGPRATTGSRTRTRGSTPPVRPRKVSPEKAGRGGGKAKSAPYVRSNPGVTARRRPGQETGPEDASRKRGPAAGEGDAGRKRGPAASDDAGRKRGAAEGDAGRKRGAAEGDASRKRGGKAGPRDAPRTRPGPGSKVGSRAKVGSRGRVDRPGPGPRVGSRGKGEAFEANKPVRGAGGDKPPRRGSAVERLLAGGEPGDRPRRGPAVERLLAGGEPGDRPTRPRPAIRDEFPDTPPAKAKAAPAKRSRPGEAAPAKPRGAAGAAKRSRPEAGAARPRAAVGAVKRSRPGEADPKPRGAAGAAKLGGEAAPRKPRPAVAAPDAGSGDPLVSVHDAESGHSAESGELAAVAASGSESGAAPGKSSAAKPAREAAPEGARAQRGWSDKPSAKPARRGAARPGSNQIKGPERLVPAKVRLQKVLASAGVAARRKAEDLIARGRVTVNGRVANELGVKVDPERDQIKVDGKVVQVETRVYFVLNKPDGVVCSAEGPQDSEGRPTVLSLLPTVTQRVYPVGRLDYHTRGVLILTNDGDLAAALTHPRHKVTKTYHVKFQGRLGETELAALGQGITLDDGVVTRPAEEVSIVKETETNSWVQITLRQGLNRQVRRMGDAIGHPVLKLIRVAIGSVTADGLEDGEFRPLTPTEVYDLLAAASR